MLRFNIVILTILVIDIKFVEIKINFLINVLRINIKIIVF